MARLLKMAGLLFPVFLLSIIHLSVPDDSVEDKATTPEEGKVIHEEILQQVPYMTPKPTGNVFIAETFDDINLFHKRWVKSRAKKEDASDDVAKYDGEWSVESPEKDSNKKDLGLVLKSKAKLHAISSRLYKPYVFKGKPFILQFEVKFQNGQECGGAYIKLLTEDPNLQLAEFHDKVPYTIMFGPDKCGADSKLHLIFRHKNPKNGSIEEKHWKKTPNVPKLDEIFKDNKPHLFSLVLTPDDQFEVKVDNHVVQRGSLLQEFEPPVNPPAEIDDPTDFKPKDWDDKPKIPDPDDFKPDDWDEDALKEIPDAKAEKPEGWLDKEEETIPNPDAVKPADWDDDMDGEWEAPRISNPACETAPGCGQWTRPMIPNPEYKGKWKPAMVDNPNYKGVWKPKRIPNPDFFEDKKPYYMMPIGAVGFELWSISNGILFDNIIISDSVLVAEQFAEDSFALKKEKADAESDSVVVRFIKYSNKRPWLWAVYLVILAIPLVLFITFCCGTTAKEKNTNVRKKNDDVQVEDDKMYDEDENEGDGNRPLIEEQPAEEEYAEQDDEEKVDEDGNNMHEQLDEDDAEELEEDDAEEQEGDAEELEEADDEVKPIRTSPRRRKPRKDL